MEAEEFLAITHNLANYELLIVAYESAHIVNKNWYSTLRRKRTTTERSKARQQLGELLRATMFDLLCLDEGLVVARSANLRSHLQHALARSTTMLVGNPLSTEEFETLRSFLTIPSSNSDNHYLRRTVGYLHSL